MTRTADLPILISVVGPTASGKTALGVALAQALQTEVFSADSRQFYRGMNIGTAKPSAEERAAVPHHFIDILDPWEDYSAGQFETDVLEALHIHFQKHRLALLVGGSGMYIKAALEGLDELPRAEKHLRDKWRQTLAEEGLEALQRAVHERDPEYAAEVDLQNPQRLQRALEVMDTTGEKMSGLRKGLPKKRPFQHIGLLLDPPREWLYERINLRTDAMMQEGLLDEVQRLLPYRSTNAMQTVGYREIMQHFDGEYTLDEAIGKIKQHTRNYAKRQTTWFRAQTGLDRLEDADFSGAVKHLRTRLPV